MVVVVEKGGGVQGFTAYLVLCSDQHYHSPLVCTAMCTTNGSQKGHSLYVIVLFSGSLLFEYLVTCMQ